MDNNSENLTKENIVKDEGSKITIIVVIVGLIAGLFVAFVFFLIPMSFVEQAQNESSQSLIYSEAKAQADASGDQGIVQGNMAEWADSVIAEADATPLRPRVTTDVIVWATEHYHVSR